MLTVDHTTLRDRLDDVAALAARTNKATVLVVQQFPVATDSHVSFPPVRESIANVMMFVELGTVEDLRTVLASADSFNWMALDCDHKLPESPAIVQTTQAAIAPARLLFFSDNQVWVDSALDMVQRIERGVSGKMVLLAGAGALVESLALMLPRLGASVVLPDAGDAPIAASIVLGASQKQSSVDRRLIDRLPATAAIYDLGIGNLTIEAAEHARARGHTLYRLDNRAGISSAIIRLLETDNMVTALMGRVRLRDVDVVAGGLLAPAGAVIVDDIRRPTMVFGVADGAGRFKSEPLGAADRERFEYVRSMITLASKASPGRYEHDRG